MTKTAFCDGDVKHAKALSACVKKNYALVVGNVPATRTEDRKTRAKDSVIKDIVGVGDCLTRPKEKINVQKWLTHFLTVFPTFMRFWDGSTTEKTRFIVLWYKFHNSLLRRSARSKSFVTES